jgi:hypothetical protein
VLEKAVDGKDILNITMEASGLGGGGARQQIEARSELCLAEHTDQTGQTSHAYR